ncbi:MAG: BspA family leucine-rich repeat surface protein [Bacteroidaceae bacterium]|nr:BspA family leucine-rich repeat surface protein [Bacteroidaceae bacterium]
MKKGFVLAALLLMAAGLQRAWALDAYAVMKDGTVTFYYDNLKNSRDGVLEIHDTYGTPYPYKAATTAVFDASFANYRPTSTAYWFQNCNLTSISGLENLRTDNVTDMQYMFGSCGELTSLDLSGFNTENVTNMCNMFQMCWNLKSLDLSGFKTSKVTDMSWMFQGCVLLPSLDLSSFNTKSVTDMNKMFSYCSSLASLDVSGFNTEKVTKMSDMFSVCSKLVSLNLCSFNTAGVKDMSYMFSRCSDLTTIYVSDGLWNTESVTNGGYMFWQCTSLVGSNGTAYDDEHYGYEYACVDTPGQPGYLTSFEKYDLKIVGKQVTSENCSDFYGDGTVSFDPETSTLTLNNANITGDNEKSLIETTSSLNILLIGENTVSDAWCETCIYANLSDSDGEVHITGPGSLHVVGGGIGIGVSAGLSIDGGAQVKVQGEEGGIFAVMKLSISGKETVVMTKAGQLPIASINLTLNDGLIVGLPEGVSFKYIQFGEEIEQSLYTIVAADGNIVVNEWVVIASQDYITGSPLLTSPEEEGQGYNMAGQKVGESYKGIVIRNGKKTLKK